MGLGCICSCLEALDAAMMGGGQGFESVGLGADGMSPKLGLILNKWELGLGGSLGI